MTTFGQMIHRPAVNAGWVRSFTNGVSGQYTSLNDMASDDNGNSVLLLGSNTDGVTSNMVVIYMNSAGTVMWKRFIAPTQNDIYASIGSIGFDSTGAVYITLANYATPNNSAHLLKYNSSGVLQWKRMFSTADSLNNGPFVQVNKADNSVYMLVQTSPGSGFFAHVMKYNSSGTLLWNKDMSNATRSWPGIWFALNSAGDMTFACSVAYSDGSSFLNGYEIGTISASTGAVTAGTLIHPNNNMPTSYPYLRQAPTGEKFICPTAIGTDGITFTAQRMALLEFNQTTLDGIVIRLVDYTPVTDMPGIMQGGAARIGSAAYTLLRDTAGTNVVRMDGGAITYQRLITNTTYFDQSWMSVLAAMPDGDVLLAGDMQTDAVPTTKTSVWKLPGDGSKVGTYAPAGLGINVSYAVSTSGDIASLTSTPFITGAGGFSTVAGTATDAASTLVEIADTTITSSLTAI